MPVLLRYRGYRFFFYVHEGSPREPVHVRVRQGNSEAKIWLHPFVSLCYNRGVPARDLADIMRVVMGERVMIEGAWNEFFQS